MRDYKSYSYVYPPRPENKLSSEVLPKFDNGSYVAQPKLNGSCCEVYIDGKSVKVMNRHKKEFSNMKLSKEELSKLGGGKGYNVFVGEYMNKSQKDGTGKVFNQKFVIFDILVSDGKYLIGTSYEKRLSILKKKLNLKSYDDYLYKISSNIFMVKSFYSNFKELYESVIKIDMYEGWVLKRKSAKLERGTREKNNTGWLYKCRKPTKNYQF